MSTPLGKPGTPDTGSGADARLLSLLKPDAISQILGSGQQAGYASAEIEWPDRASVRDARVERVWPTRDGRFVFEWSFKLDKGKRFSLFAETGASSQTAPERCAGRVRLTDQGIRGVMVRVPQWDILLFSPDRDPGMPHLARCLDETEMSRRLAPYWNKSTGKPAMQASAAANDTPPITCRLLGYRAGKRAAIAFDPASSSGARCQLLGKIFCGDRAQQLQRRHEALGALLASSTDGRVGTTQAIGLLPDLHMVLFAWKNEEVLPSRDHALAGVDAMVALHQTEMADLPDFSVDDECRVVTRWHTALTRLAPPLAEATAPILEALLSAADSLDPCRMATLHRDFYERQFIHDGSTTTLLDLDTLARGDPGVDMGNYLTHLVLRGANSNDAIESTGKASLLDGKVGLLDAVKPEPASRLAGLVRHYLACGGELNRRSLAFYWASSLFRVGSVHAVRHRTKAFSPSMWKLAADVLCYMGHGVTFRVPDHNKVSALPDARSVLEEVPL